MIVELSQVRDLMLVNQEHPISWNCSNYRGNRGTCNETHYIRADSLEQVVCAIFSLTRWWKTDTAILTTGRRILARRSRLWS